VQCRALVASNLGWTFDGFEVFALILTVGVALRELLDAGQYPLILAYAGAVIAITVLGWALGGLIGGVLADYIGRKRTMILAILAYSLMTGLSVLSWDWLSFAVLRFLVGVAIGSEWATGASLVAELWPDDARGRGGAFLQSGFAIGAVLASGVWLVIGETGPGAWRYIYLVGVLPALLTFGSGAVSPNPSAGSARTSVVGQHATCRALHSKAKRQRWRASRWLICSQIAPSGHASS
jgi:MFS family permease